MSDHDLAFPRIVYRGEPDTLGEGKGETCRVEDQADLDAKQKQGWRLTREDGKPVPAAKGTLKIPAQTVEVDGVSAKDAQTAQQRADADAQAAKDTAARVAKGKEGLAAPAKNALKK